MSDCESVMSSHSASSVTLSKMSCPHCSKDLQARAMFAHIRKYHYNDFLKSTCKRFLEDAETGKPLRVFWTVVNDFDEEEEVSIYACLSSNKTFLSLHKATAHFAKDKTLLKDHNKQLKQVKKDYMAMKKQVTKAKRTESPFKLRLKTAMEANDPELARALWRGILNHKRTCEIAMILCNRRCYCDSTPCFRDSEEISFLDVKKYHHILLNRVQMLLHEKSLNVKNLRALWIDFDMFIHKTLKESLFGFSEDMKVLHPSYNYVGEEKFYNYATEEMQGVSF